MGDKSFQNLVDEERDAFQEHMDGAYDPDQRANWEEKRKALVEQFWDEAGGK